LEGLSDKQLRTAAPPRSRTAVRSEDNIMPPAVNQSNAKHYRHTKSVTDYHEFPGRSHYTVGEDGWQEVADYALEWAEANATRPAA
jgi:hypothetical protein